MFKVQNHPILFLPIISVSLFSKENVIDIITLFSVTFEYDFNLLQTSESYHLTQALAPDLA